jgi:hypothetical protein
MTGKPGIFREYDTFSAFPKNRQKCCFSAKDATEMSLIDE